MTTKDGQSFMNVNTKQEENQVVTMQKKKDTGFLFLMIVVCIITVLINVFICQIAIVNGSSMSPTLEDGQFLLISKFNHNFNRGDIVVFKDNGIFVIKRVIGLPNETVQIKDNSIYINGEKIKDYVDVEMDSYGLLSNEVKLKDNEYILLGDNRNNSLDSRHESIGIVSGDIVIGRVFFRFIPWSNY